MSEARGTDAASDKGFDVFGFVARFAPTIFLIVLMLLFAVVEPRFLSGTNLFNVMRQVSITGLLAVGMTFVILTAGIDLSVGSLVAFAGLVGAAVAKGGLENRFTVGEGGVGYGWGTAALAAIAVGVLCGWLQGVAITRTQGAALRRDFWAACRPFEARRYCLPPAVRSRDFAGWCRRDRLQWKNRAWGEGYQKVIGD